MNFSWCIGWVSYLTRALPTPFGQRNYDNIPSPANTCPRFFCANILRTPEGGSTPGSGATECSYPPLKGAPTLVDILSKAPSSHGLRRGIFDKKTAVSFKKRPRSFRRESAVFSPRDRGLFAERVRSFSDKSAPLFRAAAKRQRNSLSGNKMSNREGGAVVISRREGMRWGRFVWPSVGGRLPKWLWRRRRRRLASVWCPAGGFLRSRRTGR